MKAYQKAYQIETISSSQARFINIPFNDLNNKTIHSFFPQEMFTVIDFNYSQVINSSDIALYYTLSTKQGNINGVFVLIEGMDKLKRITGFIYRSIIKLNEKGLMNKIPTRDEIINKIYLWKER